MFPIEPAAFIECDEELGTVGVRSTVKAKMSVPDKTVWVINSLASTCDNATMGKT